MKNKKPKVKFKKETYLPIIGFEVGWMYDATITYKQARPSNVRERGWKFQN